MGRGAGDYARDFLRNLRDSDEPLGRKARLIVRNRLRAGIGGCCGHPGEPGC